MGRKTISKIGPSSLILLTLMLSLFLSACNNNKKTSEDSQVATLPYIDSIIKYDTGTYVRLDNLKANDSAQGAMIIADVNNSTRIAIVAFDNAMSYCYKKEKDKWTFCDSFKSNVYPSQVCFPDINGDGFKDIRLSFPVMRGNYVCAVLLYQPNPGIFKHNRFYDQMNIGYDSATNLVRVSGLGGLFDNIKKLYKVTGDSLTFYKSVEMHVSATDSIGELIFYENIGGNKSLVRTIKQNCNKVSEDFDDLFWSDYLAYFDKGTCL